MDCSELIGKNVEMWIEGLGKIACLVKEVKDGVLIINSKGREFRCPISKVGLHRVVLDAEVRVHQVRVYMCKNADLACKGVKLLISGSKSDPCLSDMPCEHTPEKRESCGCEFAKVGNLYDLPPDIQNRFLDGLTTGPGPIRDTSVVLQDGIIDDE